MQLIPADWQNKIESLQTKTIEAYDATFGTEEERDEDSAYKAAHQEFMDYIVDTFGSPQTFHEYMKADLSSAASAKGVDAITPKSWDEADFSKEFTDAATDPTTVATDLWLGFHLIYRPTLQAINNVPALAQP